MSTARDADQTAHCKRLRLAFAIGLMVVQGSTPCLAEVDPATNESRPSPVALAAIPFDQAEPNIGAEINEVCAGCHGPHGEGGKEGEYPRLAGLPADFIARQLLLFRSRDRKNLAMVEYVDHRQMPDEDIAHISVYLANVDLPNRLPPLDPDAGEINAYQRLLDAERVVQIPLAPGDVDQGGVLYRRECASCHGRNGSTDAQPGVPMLAGQYTAYLWRQIPKYIDKRRIHDPEDPGDELLAVFSEDELRDILAYVSTLDD
jgi:cytochrome c553